MQRIVLVCLVVCLTACQSISFPSSTIEKIEQPYPAVSLSFLDRGTSYGTPLYQVSNAIYNQVAASGLFQGVTINNTYVPFKVYVNFTDNAEESGGMAFIKGLLAGISLFLIPVSKDYQYEATFRVILLDRELKTYKYDLNHEGWMHLTQPMPAQVQEMAAESLTNMFLADMSKDKQQLNHYVQSLTAPAGQGI